MQRLPDRVRHRRRSDVVAQVRIACMRLARATRGLDGRRALRPRGERSDQAVEMRHRLGRRGRSDPGRLRDAHLQKMPLLGEATWQLGDRNNSAAQ